VPVPPEILEDTPVDSDKEDSDLDQEFQYDLCSTETQLFSQSELNDLVKDLGLPKDSAEVLGSRLKSKNLLPPGTCISEMLISTTFWKILELLVRSIICHQHMAFCSFYFSPECNSIYNAGKFVVLLVWQHTTYFCK
jgi:hypothetical protein